MGVLFPHSQLRVMSFNRCIQSRDMSTSSLISLVSNRFSVSEVEDPIMENCEHGTTVVPTINTSLDMHNEEDVASLVHNHDILMYTASKWYNLSPLDPVEHSLDDPIRSLGVQVLKDRLLGPIFGEELDGIIDYIPEVFGHRDLESLIDSGQANVGFCARGVTVDDIMAVADAGQLMPAKVLKSVLVNACSRNIQIFTLINMP